MIISVQKFLHYFLRNKFVFHVDYDVLKYMINKHQLSGRIARRVLLLQAFNFTVEVRLDKNHANAYHHSRLNEESESKPIDDSFSDAQLFYIDMIPYEYSKTIEYLQTYFNDKQKSRLVFKAMPYTIIVDTLYKQEKYGVLRRCVTSSKIPLLLKVFYDNMVEGHFT